MMVATTPTACGIETTHSFLVQQRPLTVGTTPTACGIETTPQISFTTRISIVSWNNTYRLRY